MVSCHHTHKLIFMSGGGWDDAHSGVCVQTHWAASARPIFWHEVRLFYNYQLRWRRDEFAAVEEEMDGKIKRARCPLSVVYVMLWVFFRLRHWDISSCAEGHEPKHVGLIIKLFCILKMSLEHLTSSDFFLSSVHLGSTWCCAGSLSSHARDPPKSVVNRFVLSRTPYRTHSSVLWTQLRHKVNTIHNL